MPRFVELSKGEVKKIQEIYEDMEYSKTVLTNLIGVGLGVTVGLLDGNKTVAPVTAKKVRNFLQRDSYPTMNEIKYGKSKIELASNEIDKLKEIRNHVATYRELSKLTRLTTSMLYGLVGGVITEVNRGDYVKIKNVIDLTYPELQELALDKDIELETDKKKYRSKTKLEIGRKYKFTSKDGRGTGMLESFQGKVIKEYEHYYLLHTGTYKTCVTKSDLLAKEYDVKKLGGNK